MHPSRKRDESNAADQKPKPRDILRRRKLLAEPQLRELPSMPRDDQHASNQRGQAAAQGNSALRSFQTELPKRYWPDTHNDLHTRCNTVTRV